MFLGLLHTLCAQVIKDIFRNKYIENIQTLSEYSMFFAFNNQIDTKMKRIATLLKFRKRIILLEILKRRKTKKTPSKVFISSKWLCFKDTNLKASFH